MADDTPTTPGGTARRPRVVVGVLAVALVASLVAGVMLWLDREDLRDQVRQADSRQQAAEDAEAAAREAITQLSTYSHKTIDQACARVEEASTESFRDQAAPCRNKAIRLVKAVKARAEGTVIEAAPKSVSDDEVELLMFVDQGITGQGGDERLSETRLLVTMVRQGDRWLLDDMQLHNYLGGGEGSE